MVDALGEHPAGDGLGDDVARGEIGQRVVVGRDDPHTFGVDEERALTPHGLADQGLLAGRGGAEPQGGRVELHELQVGHLGAGPQRERHPVAGRHGRVGGAREHLSHPAGREHHGAGVHGAHAVPAAFAEHVQRDAGGPAVGAQQQVQDQRVLAQLDVGVRPDRRDQGPADLGAGCVPAGVHDPVAVVTAFAGE